MRRVEALEVFVMVGNLITLLQTGRTVNAATRERGVCHAIQRSSELWLVGLVDTNIDLEGKGEAIDVLVEMS